MPFEHPTDEGELRRAIFDGQNSQRGGRGDGGIVWSPQREVSDQTMLAIEREKKRTTILHDAETATIR